MPGSDWYLVKLLDMCLSKLVYNYEHVYICQLLTASVNDMKPWYYEALVQSIGDNTINIFCLKFVAVQEMTPSALYIQTTH